MTSSRHDDMTALLGPAALGLLTGGEQEQLDRHLRSCAACRDELTALTAVAGRLGALDVESALAATAAARPDGTLLAVSRERRRSRHLQTAMAAAASVAVLLAGLVTATALARDAAPAVPLEPVAVSSETGVEARADLVAHTWGVEIKLEAAGLEAGRPYTVRVVTRTGEVVDAGAFLGTGDKTLSCNLNASVLREDARSFVVLDSGGRQVLSAQL